MKLEQLKDAGLKIIGGMDSNSIIFSHVPAEDPAFEALSLDRLATTDSKIWLGTDAQVTVHRQPHYLGSDSFQPLWYEMKMKKPSVLELNVMVFGLIEKWIAQRENELKRYALVYARTRSNDFRYPTIERVNIGHILRYAPMTLAEKR